MVKNKNRTREWHENESDGTDKGSTIGRVGSGKGMGEGEGKDEMSDAEPLKFPYHSAMPARYQVQCTGQQHCSMG